MLRENFFFSPAQAPNSQAFQGGFQGKEKTCPTSKCPRTRTLFYIKLESPRSNLGRLAPLSGLSRGKSPFSQPPRHLSHRGLAGQFLMPRLGGPVHRLLRLERTDFAEASILPVPAGAGSWGL